MSLPPRYQAFQDTLRAFLPGRRVLTDPLHTAAFAADASFYRLIPKMVVNVEREEEMVRVLRQAHRLGVPLTFRGAGTSLSGQAVTDSVLVKLGAGWRRVEVGPRGATIRAQPALRGGELNALLAPHGRRIGPDPASIQAATIAGIVANNASGMCCGVRDNSYHTLQSLRVILADGSLLDTGDRRSRADFAASHPELLEGLTELGRRTRADKKLAARIAKKYRIKNTTGYGLNALLDFSDPIDILAHLLVGSEGTLGFLAELTLRTVELPPHRASALVLFPDAARACQAIAPLREVPVSAAELMDRASLRAIARKPGAPRELRRLSDRTAALLIETRAGSPEVLAMQAEAIAGLLAPLERLGPVAFRTDAAGQEQLWALRKGLFPAVGAMRRAGRTVVIEDVAVEPPRLGEAVLDLQELLLEHGYYDAVIFGHALEGNLHFVFTQDFAPPVEVARYQIFMDALCELIVERYDGSLKGEHSTGRNVAPFVELEWGAEAYGLMREIKQLLDPRGILNPGVILSEDPELHIKDLKPMPAVDPKVDACTECGFCERVCPSQALTFTPRQRIVALRELAQADSGWERAVLREGYVHPGIETCAACGVCATVCPVEIDTGALIKTLRARSASPLGSRLGAWAAEHLDQASALTRVALGAAQVGQALVGPRVVSALMDGAHLLSGGRLPLWNAALPRPAPALRLGRRAPRTRTGRVVYFPSCVSRTLGPAAGDPVRAPLPAVVERLLLRAGYAVAVPRGVDRLCCGLPFASKGLFELGDAKRAELSAALEQASRGGRDAVVVDTSPCAARLREHGVALEELAPALKELVLPRLPVRRRAQTVALHATCSTRRLGEEPALRAVAVACAEEVVEPAGIHCCGWAGDKGFLIPELSASALRGLRSQLGGRCRAGYSSSRTCEIGLSLHAGVPYRSIAYLVEEATAEPLAPRSRRGPRRARLLP